MRKLLLLSLLYASASQAGIVIGGTRFVYSEKQASINIPVMNKSAASYLINTKIVSGNNWKGNESAAIRNAPFIATPPLFALPGEKENTLRLMHTGGDLPSDRESLFTISVAAIPSGAAQADSVQMAVRSNLKLFYRPDGLKGSPEEAYQQLIWHHTASGLSVENKTPYYVTLFNLKVNGKQIDDAGVVAPFSQRQTAWCNGSASCLLAWQTINDYGRVMPVVTKTLNLN